MLQPNAAALLLPLLLFTTKLVGRIPTSTMISLLLLLLLLLQPTWKSGFEMMSPAPISNVMGSLSLLVSLVDSSTCRR
jgi:hypothetical protein